jgi:para-nitrobenzyl esterase
LFASRSTTASELTGSSSWAMEIPTAAYWIKSPRSNGFRRISPLSVATRPTSPFLANRQERTALARCSRCRARKGCFTELSSRVAEHSTSSRRLPRNASPTTSRNCWVPSQVALAALSTDQLLSAQLALRADLAGHPDPERWGPEVVVNMMPWMPVVDGDVIPARPLDRIVDGASADIDLLVGSNRDEWHAFLVPGGAIDHIPDEMLIGVLASYGLPIDAALTTYRSTRPDAAAGELLSAIQGDWYFRIPALKLGEAHARSAAATYMYEFGWRSPQFGGRLGACHGLEVPFVFDALGDGTEALLGADPPQHLADTMHSAWVAFAATGNCGWPTYQHDRRSTMRFDVISQVVDDPRAAERALWQGVS